MKWRLCNVDEDDSDIVMYLKMLPLDSTKEHKRNLHSI